MKLKQLAPVVLRIGLALVFIWFGTQQLLDVKMWVGLVPDFVISISHVSATTLVHFNGAFEIVFGLALLVGISTRVTAFLLALHIIDIMFVVGYGPIGVRDFGLSVATVAIFLNGADFFTLDRLLAPKTREMPNQVIS